MRPLGAVLTGGASTRMGTVKALVEVDHVAMASRVASALHDAGISEVVAVGGDPTVLAPLGLAVVPDIHPAEGPLGGILSAIAAADGAGCDTVAVLACDMPRVEGEGVVQLLLALQERPDAAAAVASTASGGREPLLAVWRVSAAPALQAAFDSGERSVHRVLAGLDVVTAVLPERMVTNVNRPSDLPDR